ncbi:MAG: hypothetical protein K0Q61_2433 [Rhodococcus erythropolis]|jgi:hypothetical protein|nr:hypothetical protein [Rhodococcus erythropolis]
MIVPRPASRTRNVDPTDQLPLQRKLSSREIDLRTVNYEYRNMRTHNNIQNTQNGPHTPPDTASHRTRNTPRRRPTTITRGVSSPQFKT